MLITINFLQFQNLSTYYLQEAEWSQKNFKPSFEDQLILTSMSIGIPMLCVASVVGMGDALMTGTLEWVVDYPMSSWHAPTLDV